MIYRVVLDDTIDIHTSDINCMLLNPSIELEMNSAGSFTFTLPPTHPNWDDIRVLKSTIDVYENNELIFTGRVASIEKNWNNERVVKCEGALAYFNDSIHRQMKWETPLPIASEDPTVHNFLKDILDNHNVFEGSENLNRHIYIGHIYVDTELVTREVDYDTTLDILTRMCIDTNGGYFQIRKDPEDGKLYLDWLKDFTDESSQPASFGLNLLNFDTSISAEDICTGVLARGATVNDQVVTLTDVELVDETTYPDYSVTHYTDHDQDILWHRDGVATFGQVVQVHDFSDAQIAWKDQGGQVVVNSLFEVAKKWLEEKNTKVETTEVEVAELNWLGEGYPQFKLGQIVEVIDSIHMSGEGETTRLLPMYKMSCDLTNGSKKVTLGTPPKKELTQISASNSDSNTLSTGSSSSGSGSGGGGTECLVQDVWVNGVSVVSGKIARVTVPTDTVTQSQMNTAINAAVAPKANTSDVNDALALKANTVDVTNALALKANTVDVTNALALKADKSEIIDVEANPSDTATDDLTTIKIGDTVYDIPGGGGSGGSGQDYECDLLFDNDPLPSPTSGTSNVTRAYQLSGSIDDYDAVLVLSGDSLASNNLVNQLVLKTDFYRTVQNGSLFLNNASINGYTRRLYFEFTDSTHIQTVATRSNANEELMLYKVYGLKFASNVINNQYLSDYYSTEERVVGRWTDGKPVYQRTFFSNSSTTRTNAAYDFSQDIPDIELVIDREFALKLAGTSWISGTYTNTQTYRLDCSVNADAKNIGWQALGWGFSDAFCTFRYTKTTDTPGTGPTPGNLIYLPTLYSEEEREIGVWVDGKPLYQKTFTKTFTGATSNWVLFDDSVSYDKLINVLTNQLHTNGEVLPILQDKDASPRFRSYNNVIDYYTTITGSVTYTITLQYTKTTDTAGSGKYLPDGQYAHHYSTSEKVVGTWIDGSTIYEKTINLSESDFTKTNNWFWQYNYETVLPSPYTPVGIDGSAMITLEGYKHIVKLGSETYTGNSLDKCTKFVDYYRNVAFKAYPYNDSYMNFSSSARNLKILNCQITLRYTKST